MRNRDISKILRLTSNLLDLHERSPERAKMYGSAAFQVDRFDKPLFTLPLSDLAKEAGLRKEAAQVVAELIQSGTIAELEELMRETPPGILELFALKGIGPKKIAVLWKELGVESPGELLYACRENRLLSLKGFGQKTQEQLIKSIEFRETGDGRMLFAMADDTASRLIEWLKAEYPGETFELTGEVRRKELTISRIEVLSTLPAPDLSVFLNPHSIPIEFQSVNPENFARSLFFSTATAEHAEGVEISGNVGNETEIYAGLGSPFIPPELRNWSLKESSRLIANAKERLVEDQDLRGILHVHSTYSDGMNTLEEMARSCMEKGLEYLGICDHSKAAFYAHGMKEDTVMKQQEEIRGLNKTLAPFVIFSGVESDILSDGSLDYPDEILKTFDFIVASVHSNLKMQEEKAMSRLLKAIENPRTTILGHMTGRLLLSRPGYPVDHRKIIDACAANGVVIEVNANPHRLDMDWSFIPYALDRGVMISVNPDAHSRAELDYTRYGIYAARKGGLFREMTFNALGVEEVSAHFRKRREF